MKTLYFPSVCITLYQLLYIFFIFYHYRCKQKPFDSLFTRLVYVNCC